MRSSPRTIASRLSILAGVLAVVASGLGLLVQTLYRGADVVVAGWFGNDIVTLGVAMPLLAGALWWSRRGSPRARLVWMGLLLYLLYNYAFYLFGAAFNSLFLVYVTIFTLSAFALVFGLASLDVDTLEEQFLDRTPARWVAGYILVVALGLGAFWGSSSIAFVFTREVPEIVQIVGLHTNLIAALDLSMVVSVGLVAGAWLWTRQPWGFVLATIWNVKGAVYMLALSAAAVSAYQSGASDNWMQLLLWGPIGVGCTIASVVLLHHLRGSEDPRYKEKSVGD